MKKFLTLVLSIVCATNLCAKDSLIAKVHHAEPLYIDLIRDLGARKGEKEWNVGWSVANQKGVVANSTFIEYEFAPINHLGFEVELPLTFYQQQPGTTTEEAESYKNRIEGIKLATQYTFMVLPKQKFSAALAYVHEVRFHSFQTMHTRQSVFKGNVFSPVLIVAKRFNRHLHTLLYTGPVWKSTFGGFSTNYSYQVNVSIHYVTNARHFIGVEFNEEEIHHTHDLTIRPQIKVVITPNLAIGFVAGIPTNMHENGMSFMTRIIFEPRNRKK